jgi:pyruvate dehydrogenase E2 component (dihydrolipoamide acetyltransferase)
MGVDLATVQGTGHNGRITKDDVQAAAAGAQVPGTGATPAAAPAAPAAPPAPAQGDQTVELTRIQLASARNLSASWQTIPHVTHHDEADITELEAFRKQLNAEQSDVKVTMVALLLKACAAALREFPRFASQLHEDRLVLKGDLHLGFAADTPNGLVVPVIRDVARKGVLELAGELTELSGKARAGKLSPREMSGAVFTISSLGGIGGTAFTPIVNSPQVAILGVVRSQTKPVWDGTAFVPRLMLPLSLSYDHRVIDGAAAARFCVHLGRLLTDLRRALL